MRHGEPGQRIGVEVGRLGQPLQPVARVSPRGPAGKGPQVASGAPHGGDLLGRGGRLVLPALRVPASRLRELPAWVFLP